MPRVRVTHLNAAVANHKPGNRVYLHTLELYSGPNYANKLCALTISGAAHFY